MTIWKNKVCIRKPVTKVNLFYKKMIESIYEMMHNENKFMKIFISIHLLLHTFSRKHQVLTIVL